jgi:hypothetical protein
MVCVKSRRPELELFVVEVFGGVALVPDVKSPNPSDALLVFRTASDGPDALGALGFGGGFGPASKKPPPPMGGEVICGGAGFAFMGGDI